jgi:hypothetical protein
VSTRSVNRTDALTSVRAGLSIRDRLAKGDPRNAFRQRDLVAAHNFVGDIQLAQNDRDGALTSYHAGFVVIQALAELYPGTAEWQRGIIFSCLKIASVDRSKARALLARASEVARQMQQRGQLTTQDAGMSEDIARQIKALQ